MAKNGGGYGYPSPYNETDSGDGPDTTGVTGLYMGGWEEINAKHLSQTGPMDETANSRTTQGTFGGPAPGEPDPGKMGGK